jgi:hypothetical protein
MRILHGTFHVNNTAPYASSPNGNNKLSALSSVRIKTIADTTQTDNSIAKTVDLYSKTISDNRHTTPTTVAPTPLRVHPTNNSSDPIDLLYVQCRLRIPAHHPTVIHLIKTTANQTQQTSFATTVADLATIRETAPTLHATQLQNRGASSRSSPNNENNAPRNQHRAYFITDSGEDTQTAFHHQAFCASSFDPMDDIPDTAPWPNPALPQMEVNQPLLGRDFQPSANYAPPNSGATDYFPDDPQSPHQRIGPPHLENWLPDSGATSHYTPIFSDLRNVQSCSASVSLADGSTKLSTYKCTTECPFTTDDGIHSILGLTDVYYVEGLSHRLLSLTALSCTQNFSILIRNCATTIQLPNNSTYTWPIHRRELPSRHQAFSTSSSPTLNIEPDSLPVEKHYDDTVTSLNPDQRRSVTTLSLELVSRRLAHRNFRNLMVGSLHQTWHDHVLSPTIDPNTWPLRISISQKRARNTTPPNVKALNLFTDCNLT